MNLLVKRNNEIKGIHINDQEYKICQFADDTEFILDGTQESLRATLLTLERFREISGQKNEH